MDKVVTIERSYAGDTLKGYDRGVRKSNVTLKVFKNGGWTSTGYTVLSSINPVKAATNPDDLIWETFFAEGEGEHTLYLLVADNVNEYKLEVVCPDCGDQFDVKGTF